MTHIDSSDPVCLSVSIVLYENDPAEVSSVLKSVLPSILRPIVCVVDNSRDETLRKVVTTAGARYHFAGKNLGFGAAHNVAVRKYCSRSEFHLILNPDVSFNPAILSVLSNFMQANHDVGLVMPRILYPDGKEQYLCKLLPTPLDLLARRFSGRVSQALLRKRMERYVLRASNNDGPYLVPSLSGCFMFLRTSMLRQVGEFDERFFMYMEDVDLCRRIGAAAKTVFFPGVSIVHGYAKGSYQNRQLLKYHLQSAWRYFGKWGWFRDEGRERLNKSARMPHDSNLG